MRPRHSLLGEPKEKTIILTRPFKKLKDEFDLLISDLTFQKDIEQFRAKAILGIDSHIDDLKPLLKKYSLTKDWEYILRIYIDTGKFEEMGDPHGIQINIDSAKDYATMRIYRKTTLTEIKQAYSVVVEEFKKGVKKTRPADEIERDMYICELIDKKINYSEISKIIYENYNDKIYEPELRKIYHKIKKRKKNI